jgi:hypothetical protein
VTHAPSEQGAGLGTAPDRPPGRPRRPGPRSGPLGLVEGEIGLAGLADRRPHRGRRLPRRDRQRFPCPPGARRSARRPGEVAVQYLETLASRLKESAEAEVPLASDAASKWSADRSAVFAKWLGDYEKSLGPETGELTEEQKKLYREFVRDMAAGVADAVAAARREFPAPTASSGPLKARR